MSSFVHNQITEPLATCQLEQTDYQNRLITSVTQGPVLTCLLASTAPTASFALCMTVNKGRVADDAIGAAMPCFAGVLRTSKACGWGVGGGGGGLLTARAACNQLCRDRPALIFFFKPACAEGMRIMTVYTTY